MNRVGSQKVWTQRQNRSSRYHTRPDRWAYVIEDSTDGSVFVSPHRWSTGEAALAAGIKDARLVEAARAAGEI